MWLRVRLIDLRVWEVFGDRVAVLDGMCRCRSGKLGFFYLALGSIFEF